VSRLSPPLELAGNRGISSGFNDTVMNNASMEQHSTSDITRALSIFLRKNENPAIMGSCIAVFIAAIAQMLVSMVIVISIYQRSIKTIQRKLKIWLMIHFLAFVTLFLCLFIPLTMDREREAENSVMELYNHIRRHLDPIELSGIVGKQLHAYFMPVGLNVCFLFVALITSFRQIQHFTIDIDAVCC
jgi:NADH:ubiquinone oxidoreductase subunit 6 (subunit J)